MLHRVFLIGALPLMAGCVGNATDGASIQSYFSTYSAAPPADFAFAFAFAEGGASVETGTAGYGAATIALRGRTSEGGASSPANLTLQLFPNRHVFETVGPPGAGAPVADAWSAGWTGWGETIAVIDDFRDENLPVYAEATANRVFILQTEETDPDTGETTIISQPLNVPNVLHKISYATTHGDLVTMLAGGNYEQSLRLQRFDVLVDGFSATTCSVAGCAIGDETALNTAFGDVGAAATFVAMAGVAKQALMVRNEVDLSSTQDPAGTIRAIYGHVDNSRAFAAINVSISNNVNTVGMSYDQLRAMFSGEELLRTSDAVLAVAAGNTGAPCGEANLNGCNALAALFANLDQTRASTIVVGATAGTGSTESIASYSARAGALSDRFLMASGESGFLLRDLTDVPANATFATAPAPAMLGASNPVQIVGTSFAAPRVAGAAAILRQKFPNLTGADAASILLLTASKDINNDGRDDFAGVSETWGHGKLDLAKALSPIGALGGP